MKTLSLMKANKLFLFLFSFCLACTSNSRQEVQRVEESAVGGGQSMVQDDESQKNIVQVASASPDHKTLVTALTAAEYVDALSNAGPFTVFAPTDEAFGKLPKGTVDNLVKPANKDRLRNILEYHVYVGVIRENMIHNEMNLNQVNGENIKLEKTGDRLTVNDARVSGVIPTSNGIIYVIDQVLLPKEQ